MPSCWYLGVIFDKKKLTFIHQTRKPKAKLGRHCGAVSEMRYYVPKYVLLKYYNANIKLIIQNGLLVHGDFWFSILNQILMYQRKIFRMIFFKKKTRHHDQKFL